MVSLFCDWRQHSAIGQEICRSGSDGHRRRNCQRDPPIIRREKTLAEGAGAAGIAAVLNHKLPLAGKKVVVLISGGNIDVTLLSRIIERGLVKDGRLVRLRVHLPDYPGALNKLTGSGITAQTS